MTGIEKTSGILIFPDRYATPILKEGDYPLVGGECKRVVRIDKYRGIFEVEMSDRLVLKKYINRPEKSDKVDIELWLKEDVAADRVGRAFDSGGLVNGYVEAQFGEEEPDT